MLLSVYLANRVWPCLFTMSTNLIMLPARRAAVKPTLSCHTTALAEMHWSCLRECNEAWGGKLAGKKGRGGPPPPRQRKVDSPRLLLALHN